MLFRSTACGAFSCAVRQVSKIETVPIELFAQIVANLETTNGLTLLGNTDVPTNTELSNSGLIQTSYGSGPNGGYTMSDLYGCMSGLPYPWKDIQDNIISLQTSTLSSIYLQMYNTIIAGNPNLLITEYSSNRQDVKEINLAQRYNQNDIISTYGVNNEFDLSKIYKGGEYLPYNQTVRMQILEAVGKIGRAHV